MHASVANAQVYAYVEQKEYDSKEQKEVSVEVTKLGRAVINTQYSTPTVQFINGKAVMKIGKSTVASVSVIDGGVLVVEPLPSDKDEEVEAKEYNKITKQPSQEKPTSPFTRPSSSWCPLAARCMRPNMTPAHRCCACTVATRYPQVPSYLPRRPSW